MQIRTFFENLALLEEVGYFITQKENNMKKTAPVTLGEIAGSQESLDQPDQVEEVEETAEEKQYTPTVDISTVVGYVPLWRTSRGFHRIEDMDADFTNAAIRHAAHNLRKAQAEAIKANARVDFWLNKAKELNDHRVALSTTLVVTENVIAE